MPNCGELETPQLHSNFFRKTQTPVNRPRKQSQCPDTPLHSYLTFWGPRLLCEQVSGSPALGSLPGVCPCGASDAIASPWLLPLPRTGCQIAAAGCTRGSMHRALASKAAHDPGAGKGSWPMHLCAALRGRDWEHSGTTTGEVYVPCTCIGLSLCQLAPA